MITKKWYTSRTLWLNVLAIALFVVEYMTQQSWVTVSISAMIVGILNMVVRFMTSQPIGK